MTASTYRTIAPNTTRITTISVTSPFFHNNLNKLAMLYIHNHIHLHTSLPLNLKQLYPIHILQNINVQPTRGTGYARPRLASTRHC
jgi:hypothetical protein